MKKDQAEKRRTELRIADFTSALKIAPAKTDGNFIVKRAAFFYWLIGIVIAARRSQLRFISTVPCAISGAASKSRDAQLHAQRQFLW